jgi:glucoamylase
MHAFGHPGISPTWSSSAKDVVGCALGVARVWFTTGYGILNEVYFPRVDIPQIRDLGFIVADGNGFWVEVKRLNAYRVSTPESGIPAIEIVHEHPRFALRLRIVADVQRDVVLIEVALDGDGELRPYALLAPHLGGSGHDNWAEAATFHGRRILWAEKAPFGLALAAAGPRQDDAWRAVSAGYVGASDGWQDFARNGRLSWTFDAAGPGNVALIGELPTTSTLALALGSSRESAATLALASLHQPFADAWGRYVGGWRAWHASLRLPTDLPRDVRDQLSVSAMVLCVHRDKTFPGAMVASLSVPWGNTSDDLGGYHLVWPRDLVESAGGLLALGAVDEAVDVLRYLIATQRADGSWAQNQWLGGKPFRTASQLDETAFPVLLAAMLADRGALHGVEAGDMVRRALGFIAREGPVTEQDRWEEDSGITAFTVATCVSALVCGARFLDERAREHALRLADFWNACLDQWTSVRDTPLARALGVGGYYVRVAPPPSGPGDLALKRIVPIRNCADDPDLAADEQVSTDFLQLVRMGMRDALDPLVVESVAAIDRLLEVETPAGPAWHRYTGDCYGEHADGSPFDGVGRGRAWPLLTGERGHYEILAGRDPLPFLKAMCAMTGRGGLIPEQVWDAAPIPARGLLPGRPTGSAMPLVWAHAEFIKLVASRALGRPCDRPDAVWARYRGRRRDIGHAIWTRRLPIAEMAAGHGLRICLAEPAIVHHGVNGWTGIADVATEDCGLGLHVADLPTETLQPGDDVEFTFYQRESATWDGRDYRVAVVPNGPGSAAEVPT